MITKTRKPTKEPSDCIKVDKNIYQRAGGYSFQVKMTHGGVAITETLDTLAEARAWRDRKKSSRVMDPDHKQILESRIKKSEAAKSTLSLLLDKYEAEVTPRKKSAKSELTRIGKIRRYPVAELSVYTIGPDDIQEFLSTLEEEGLASPGQRKYCALISHVFNMAVKRWRMKVANPIAVMELPAYGKARDRRLETGEEAPLLAALDKENLYAGAFMRLAIETAMRRGELLGLTWDDVNLKDATIRLRDTKNGEGRGIPLSKAAVKTLQALPFPHTGNVLPIHESALRGAWGRAKEKTGIIELRVHDLRHEAISRLFEKGEFSDIEIATITGHKTMQMLKRYAHLRTKDLVKRMG